MTHKMFSSEHARKVRRLRILSGRLNRMIENGSFYALPFWKRYGLVRRVKRLYGSLVGPLSPAALRVVLAGAAAIVIGACAPAGGDDGSVADNPSFAGAAQPFDLDAVTSQGAPAFADIGEDGDADLFAGAGGEGAGAPVLYSVNTGSSISPSFSALSPYPGLTSYNLYGIVPVLVPIDGDADFDLFVGHLADGFPTLEYYRNDSGTFVSDDTIPGLPSGGGPDDRALTATFVDIDGDGDLDAFVSRTWYYVAYETYYGTEIRYYENTGTRASPAFTNRGPSFGLDSPSDYGAFPTFVDIDADGDFDAFVGDNYGSIQFFRNTGTPTAPAFAAAQANPFGLSAVANPPAVPAFVDIDADGDFDLFVGDGIGNIWFFENTNL